MTCAPRNRDASLGLQLLLSFAANHADGFVLIGDAAAFIDPLFSCGVMLAMSSATCAAEAVQARLDGDPAAAVLIRDYERKQRRGLRAFSWLICRINTPILRDMLLAEFDRKAQRPDRDPGRRFPPVARVLVAAALRPVRSRCARLPSLSWASASKLRRPNPAKAQY